MNIKLELKGTKSIKGIYLRLYKSKLDISKPTGFSIAESDWDDVNCKPKNDPELHLKLSELVTGVLKAFNIDFGNGVVINGDWLSETIKTVLNRPKYEVGMVVKSENLFLADYAEHWIKFKSAKWRVNGKFMSQSSKENYLNAISKFREFMPKVLIKSVGYDTLQNFADYLVGKDYAKATVLKNVDRIAFFLYRAIEDNHVVDESFRKPVWVDDDAEIDDFYLNEDDIRRIADFDFSNEPYLDSVRDLFVINLRTGVRISDLMNTLTTESIRNGFISLKNKKTGAQVVIPIHSDVTNILNKRFGNLPPRCSDKEYNSAIKEIGRLCGFTQMIVSKVFDKDSLRKKTKYLPMYQFFTSHLCRKSLTTNLKGKISDGSLQSLMGWSNSRMSQLYNKKSKMEYAKEAMEAFAFSK